MAQRESTLSEHLRNLKMNERKIILVDHSNSEFVQGDYTTGDNVIISVVDELSGESLFIKTGRNSKLNDDRYGDDQYAYSISYYKMFTKRKFDPNTRKFVHEPAEILYSQARRVGKNQFAKLRESNPEMFI